MLVKLTLSIGLDAERKEEIELNDLVEGWKEMSEEELEAAMHQAWKEWAFEYIDGAASPVDEEQWDDWFDDRIEEMDVTDVLPDFAERFKASVAKT